MKKLVGGFLSAMLLASLLTGCSAKTKTCSANALFKSKNVQAATLEQETDEEYRRAYSEFVFGVMQNCAESSGKQNIVISPDSLFFALEMAAAGADAGPDDRDDGSGSLERGRTSVRSKSL